MESIQEVCKKLDGIGYGSRILSCWSISGDGNNRPAKEHGILRLGYLDDSTFPKQHEDCVHNSMKNVGVHTLVCVDFMFFMVGNV